MLSRLSIKRPVTTIMVLCMVIFAGILSYSGLNLALMPSIDIPVAVVSTTYVGAGPSEMETLVTKPVEEALATVSNVDKITSVSNANVSTVIIQFVDGTDIDMATLDLREKLDLMRDSLPDEAREPLVIKMDMNAQPVSVGVTSDQLDLQELNDLLDENVVKKLERIEGVSAVSLSGGEEKEIEITISPEKMEGYGISANQVAQVLSAENMNMPSGSVYQGSNKLQIRMVGAFSTVDEISHLSITTATGGVLQLRDIAQIEEVTKEKASYTLIDGREGILISLDKQSTANLVEVSDRINEELEKIRAEHPEILVNMLSDTAEYIKLSISNVTVTAFQSAAIAILVLFLFLRSPATSLIIGISIPTSILATFALMYMRGMTMNIISMGGITIGIGMLVDNSVVVLDNIYKYWQRGWEPKDAARKGASEVGMAVVASTLTTIAVFFPMMFVKGAVGQMLQDLAYTICFALTASLVVSLTFVPMACSRLMTRNNRKGIKADSQFTRFLDAWGEKVDSLGDHYKKVLRWALDHRKRVIVMVIGTFVATLAISPLVGFDFMPEMDEGILEISVDMPRGSKIENTAEAVDRVLYSIQELKEVDLVYANVGGTNFGMGGTDKATVTVNLVKKKDRDRGINEIKSEVENLVADIAGVDIQVSASGNAMGSFGGSDISLNITGYEPDVLMQVDKEVRQELSTVEGIKNLTSTVGETVPEVRLLMDRNRAAQYGITTASVVNAMSTALTGSVATQYKVDGDEIDVRIRQDKDNLRYVEDLSGITVTSPTGITIPITEVATLSVEESAVEIYRQNQKQYITISGDTDGIDSKKAQKRIDQVLENYNFPEGYGYEYGGTMEQMEDSFKSLLLAFVAAVLLIYMIMAAQFESFMYPFVVMFSMPLAITGGILGLLVTGNSITTTSFMGFIMLVGMVVNNAIVLVDYTNQLMDRGTECDEALLEAGSSRLRAILMTTLTTIVGLMPMAFGNTEGMEMQRPLGIAVIFGLLVSTVITLVFIPVVYSGMNHRKQIRKEKKEKKEKETLNEEVLIQE